MSDFLYTRTNPLIRLLASAIQLKVKRVLRSPSIYPLHEKRPLSTHFANTPSTHINLPTSHLPTSRPLHHPPHTPHSPVQWPIPPTPCPNPPPIRRTPPCPVNPVPEPARCTASLHAHHWPRCPVFVPAALCSAYPPVAPTCPSRVGTGPLDTAPGVPSPGPCPVRRPPLRPGPCAEACRNAPYRYIASVSVSGLWWSVPVCVSQIDHTLDTGTWSTALNTV